MATDLEMNAAGFAVESTALVLLSRHSLLVKNSSLQFLHFFLGHLCLYCPESQLCWIFSFGHLKRNMEKTTRSVCDHRICSFSRKSAKGIFQNQASSLALSSQTQHPNLNMKNLMDSQLSVLQFIITQH